MPSPSQSDACTWYWKLSSCGLVSRQGAYSASRSLAPILNFSAMPAPEVTMLSSKSNVKIM